MTLTNQIHHALRHGVAKNGKIVMERVSIQEIAKRVGLEPENIVRNINYLMANDLIEGNNSGSYWRKGKGCV